METVNSSGRRIVRLLICKQLMNFLKHLPGISSLQFHGPWVAFQESKLDVTIDARSSGTVNRSELRLPDISARSIQVETCRITFLNSLKGLGHGDVAEFCFKLS